MLPNAGSGRDAADRRVDVDRTQRIEAARPHVVGAEIRPRRQRLLEANRRLVDDRLIDGAVADHARRQPRALAFPDRERRILHDDVDLVRAVDANRLLVKAGVVPVIENAVAAAHGRGAGGVPRQGRARREIPSRFNLRLQLVPQAETELKRSRGPEIILDEPAGLGLRVLDQRIAGADRVGRRLAVVKGVEARERIGAEGIRTLIAVPPARFRTAARREASAGVRR